MCSDDAIGLASAVCNALAELAEEQAGGYFQRGSKSTFSVELDNVPESELAEKIAKHIIVRHVGVEKNGGIESKSYFY